MNKLLSKLRDFGLIIPVEANREQEVISVSRALKIAHIPVALFPYSTEEEIDRVRISNENEDMFIGARCKCSYREIRSAFASGAHFAICPADDLYEIQEAISAGFDLYVEIDSIDEIKQLKSADVSAVVIDLSKKQYPELIDYCTESDQMPFFITGTWHDEELANWRNRKSFIAAVTPMEFSKKEEEEIISEAFMLIQRFLGISYLSLKVREDSGRIAEARTFAALSTIPLIVNEDEEELLIGVKDMDRTIAHLKWREIFMDPFNARMEEEELVWTELYTDFLGWPVRLTRLT